MVGGSYAWLLWRSVMHERGQEFFNKLLKSCRRAPAKIAPEITSAAVAFQLQQRERRLQIEREGQKRAMRSSPSSRLLRPPPDL